MIRRGKILAALAALLVCALMAPAIAPAATIQVDGDAAADAGGCGEAANPCATIQAGVDAASPGDTVRVATSDRPYAESISITKTDLKLVGPQENVPGSLRETEPDLALEALVEAPAGAPAAITVSATGVRIDGLFFAAAPGTTLPAIHLTPADGDVRDNVIVNHTPGLLVEGAGHRVSANLFAQTQERLGAQGVSTDASVSDIVLKENRFENLAVGVAFGGDPIKRGISIEGNALVGGPGSVGLDLAGLTESRVRGNTLSGLETGIVVGAANDVAVEGNTVIGGGVAGIRVVPHESLDANSGLAILRNQLLANGDPEVAGSAGISVLAGALAGDVAVVANRFVGHADRGVPALAAEPQEGGQRIVAANNWWGCNEGPGSEGCDTTAGADVVNAPWLVLSAAAIPSNTPAPGNVRLSAGIQRNSAGGEIPELGLLGPLPIEFTKVDGPGTIGSVASTGGGAAQARLESSDAGLALVRAALDAATADVQVEFTAPFAIPPPPAPPVPYVDTKWPRLRDLRAVTEGRRTAFRYLLSEPAVVRYVLDRPVRGRKSGDRCLARRSSRRGPRCTLRVPIGSFAVQGAAGANLDRFDGRLGDRVLKPATYRATLVATDAAGNAGAPKRIAFTVEPSADVSRSRGRRGS